MNISSSARRGAALFLVAAAMTAALVQAEGNAATGLDVTNLPCTPSCPSDLATDVGTVPAQNDVGKRDGTSPARRPLPLESLRQVRGATRTVPVVTDDFDWADAGAGAGVGIAAMLLGLAGALGARRHRSLARS
jgi:hypothetical protein